MKKHRQFFATNSEPTEFVSIVSSIPVVVQLEGYQPITSRSYLRLKWLTRKLRILNRVQRISAKASKIKKTLVE